jgi:hypothetical protein
MTTAAAVNKFTHTKTKSTHTIKHGNLEIVVNLRNSTNHHEWHAGLEERRYIKCSR